MFNTINNYITKNSNKFLSKFYQEIDFEKQTEILNNAFKYLGNEKETKIGYNIVKMSLKENYSLNGQIEKIATNYFIMKDYNMIKLGNYNIFNNQINTIKDKEIQFGNEIYSMTLSTLEFKILICLSKDKIVKIINYNNQLKFCLSSNNIKDSQKTELDHFYKCIQINKNHFVTSDDTYIKIWEDNTSNFNVIEEFEINAITYDLLLIKEEFFISSQPGFNTLILYNIKNLS